MEIRLLLVDDEPARVLRLRRALIRFEPAWHIASARQPEEALRKATTATYDVVAIHWQPNRSSVCGLDLCKRIRELCPGTSLVVLTVHEDLADRVAVASAGADDHVVRRHGVHEIHARLVLAALRGPVTRRVSRCGPLCVDYENRRTTVAGTVLDLSQHQWLLLAQLARCAGKPIGAHELCIAAGIQPGFQNKNLSNEIHRLRQRLNERQAGAGDMITAVRGVGYALCDSSRRHGHPLSPENEGWPGRIFSRDSLPDGEAVPNVAATPNHHATQTDRTSQPETRR